MLKFYAGIGSRETPQGILDLMYDAAQALAQAGWVLRTGGAQGADSAFYRGAVNQFGERELYLPWKGFEGHQDATLDTPTEKALWIAKATHPAWDKLKQGGQKLHGRNTHQVLGADCDTPASFVLCWTPEGKGGGGTGQAIRLAKHYGIPVFDLALPEIETRIISFVAAWDTWCATEFGKQQESEIRAETAIPQHLVW